MKDMLCVDFWCQSKHCKILSQINTLDFLIAQIKKENHLSKSENVGLPFLARVDKNS